MFFNSMEIKNIRCYEDEKFDFKYDDKKPVCLVVGDNSSGKTTLLLSFLWVFYGQNGLQAFREEASEAKRMKLPKSNFEFLRKQVKTSNAPKEIMRVRLWFTDDEGVQWLIERSMKNKNIGQFSSQVDWKLDDVTIKSTLFEKSGPDAQRWIDESYPLETSRFFIFDGENIGKYATLEEDVQEAIQDMVGMGTVRSFSEILRETEKGFRNVMKDIEGEDVSGILRAIDDVVKEIEDEKEKKKGYQEEVKKKNKKVEKGRKYIEDHAETVELGVEMAGKDGDRKSMIVKVNSYYDGLGPLVVENIPYVLLQKPLKDIYSRYENVEIDDLEKKIKEERNKKYALVVILNGERCLCGNDISEGKRKELEEEITEINKEIKNMEDRCRKIDDRTPKQSELRDGLNRISHYKSNHEEIYGKIMEEKIKIDEVDAEIDSLKKKLHGTEDVDLKKVVEDWEDRQREVNTLNAQIGTIDKYILDELETKQKKLRRDLATAQLNSKTKTKTKTHHDFAHHSKLLIDSILNSFEKKKRELVSDNMNDYFQKIKNPKEHYGKLEINTDFEIKCYEKDDPDQVISITDTSEGYAELISLSFIRGLNKATKLKLPVIMDFPFGRLDGTNKKLLSKHVPDLTQHNILICTDDEVDAIEPELDNYCSVKYNLNRDYKKQKTMVAVRK